MRKYIELKGTSINSKFSVRTELVEVPLRVKSLVLQSSPSTSSGRTATYRSALKLIGGHFALHLQPKMPRLQCLNRFEDKLDTIEVMRELLA